LNPLQCPPTCSSDIYCNVYTSAGPDFELASLRSDGALPIYKPEGLDLAGGAQISDLSNTQNIACFGDSFTSLKQLMNMLCRVNVSVASAGNITMWPFFLSYSTTAINSSSTLTRPRVSCDYLDYFSQGYSLSRGGVRIVVPSQASTSVTPQLTQLVTHGPADPIFAFVATSSVGVPTPAYIAASSTTTTFSSWIGPTSLNLSTRCVTDSIVPHNSGTPIKINRPRAIVGDAPGYKFDEPRNYLRTSGNIGPSLYRAAADDYTLGYFIGFPPLLYFVSPKPALLEENKEEEFEEILPRSDTSAYIRVSHEEYNTIAKVLKKN